MKPILYLLLFLFLGCNNRQEQTVTGNSNDTSIIKESSRKKYKSNDFIKSDSLTIITDLGDTLIYERSQINKILKENPELLNDNTQNPDQNYYCEGEKNGFNSEAGRDVYYILYAYFLKNRNGDVKYADKRKILINLFQNINSLFQKFEHGGTYFGHQYLRILAYAEYSIYLFKENEVYGISKTYNINKQKQLYIASLRQLIIDEIKMDNNTLGSDKIKRTIELNNIVNAIDSSITDNYYLRRMQEFHYGHYEYY